MRTVTRLAALVAAAVLSCAPAAAQTMVKDSALPPAGTLTGAEGLRAVQGSGCATSVSPCANVRVTPAQIATYLGPTFQAADVDLAAIAALATQPFGRARLTDPDAATARAALGLGSLAIQSGTFSGTSSGTNTGDQTLAGLGGQPLSPILTAWSGLTLAADTCVYWTTPTIAATYPCTPLGRKLVASSTGSQAAAAIGTSYILARSTTPQSVTGTTSETTLATITIPAGAIGPTGFVEVSTLWSMTANANGKALNLRLNGNQLAFASAPTNPGYRTMWAFNNVNSQASQVGNAGSGAGASGFALYRTSVDTSVATTLTISGTPAVSSDTLTLESWIVRIIYGS